MDEPEEIVRPSKAERASELAALGLNAVPYAGGVLAGIANEIIERRQNRRLEGFLRDLSNDLQAVENRLNEDFLRTEEFEDFSEELISGAANTRQKEKLDAFRAIFVNTAISDAPRYEKAAEIAQLLQGWQTRHIVLLKILNDPVAADRELGNPVGEGGGITTSIGQILQALLPDWERNAIDRTWGDLHDARIHNTGGTRTMMTDKGIHQLAGRLTPFGQEVAGYLDNPAEDSTSSV